MPGLRTAFSRPFFKNSDHEYSRGKAQGSPDQELAEFDVGCACRQIHYGKGHDRYHPRECDGDHPGAQVSDSTCSGAG